jgi:hypothetical protein
MPASTEICVFEDERVMETSPSGNGARPIPATLSVVIAGGHVVQRCTSSCQHGQIIPQRGIVAPEDCGLMEIEHLIRYAPLAVGLMKIEK